MTNMVGLAAALIGDRMYYWVDPLGAILLAAYIIVNWSQTALENIRAMVGMSAPPEFLTRLTYLRGIIIQTSSSSTPSGRTRSVRNTLSKSTSSLTRTCLCDAPTTSGRSYRIASSKWKKSSALRAPRFRERTRARALTKRRRSRTRILLHEGI